MSVKTRSSDSELKAKAVASRPTLPANAHARPSANLQGHPAEIARRAAAKPDNLSALDLLQLQRTVGNRASLTAIQPHQKHTNPNLETQGALPLSDEHAVLDGPATGEAVTIASKSPPAIQRFIYENDSMKRQGIPIADLSKNKWFKGLSAERKAVAQALHINPDKQVTVAELVRQFPMEREGTGDSSNAEDWDESEAEVEAEVEDDAEAEDKSEAEQDDEERPPEQAMEMAAQSSEPARRSRRQKLAAIPPAKVDPILTRIKNKKTKVWRHWWWTGSPNVTIRGKEVDPHSVHLERVDVLGQVFWGSYTIVNEGSITRGPIFKVVPRVKKGDTKPTHTEPQYLKWVMAQLLRERALTNETLGIILEVNQTNTPCAQDACRPAILAHWLDPSYLLAKIVGITTPKKITIVARMGAHKQYSPLEADLKPEEAEELATHGTTTPDVTAGGVVHMVPPAQAGMKMLPWQADRKKAFEQQRIAKQKEDREKRKQQKNQQNKSNRKFGYRKPKR